MKISAQSSRKGDDPPTHVRFQLDLSEDENDNEDNTETNVGQRLVCPLNLLEDQLVLWLRSSASDTLQEITFDTIDDRLPNFINTMLRAFTERNKPIKKLILENCVSQRDQTGSKLDASVLRQALGLCEEFHLDHEVQEPGAEQEVSFCLSILSQITSLKVIVLSHTFCENMPHLINILKSNSSLKEFVLCNAFSKFPKRVQKSRLKPLFHALRHHPSLQKFTLLQSDFDAPVYKWAIREVLENQNIIGLLTDGYYSHNATWLGRFLATNSQLREVNLPHPGFEFEYDRFSTRSAAFSLIQGLARNSFLTSIQLFGIALHEETALALRALIESTEMVTKISCGNGETSPACLSIIVGGLAANTSIQNFSIEAADLDLAGAQTVADVLTHNIALQYLSICCRSRHYFLRNRQEGPDSIDRLQVAIVLADGLRRNRTLKHLELPINENTPERLAPILSVLKAKQNLTLERLTFSPKQPCNHPEVQYWIRLNRCGGRKLIRDSATLPLALWAHVLAGVARHTDLVRYFVTELPSLVDVDGTRPRCLTVEEGDEDDPAKKRAKHA